MYSERLVAAIKVNGQILREQGDTVSLPFGAEYSVLIKNLNSVRAQISVSVDGKDATDGTRLIIPPNSSIELERFIRNGNLQAGNRFRFIERTGDVEKHRGIGSDDGLIRVEGWREYVQQFVDVPVPNYVPYDVPVSYYPRPWYPWPLGHPSATWSSNNTSNTSVSANTANTQTGSVGTPKYRPPMRPGQPQMKGAPQAKRGQQHQAKGSPKFRSFDSTPRMDSVVEQERSDAGITVPGSESLQQFHHASGFRLEPQSTVIVLRLRGSIDGVAIPIPVTVNDKPSCSTCGKANKANSQFCSVCGTALSLI